MLWRTGFTPGQADTLLKDEAGTVREFHRALNYFEDVKTVSGTKKVPDGIDHPPVFLVRHILRELPRFFLEYRKKGAWPLMPAERFCEIMAASYIDTTDLQLTETRRQKAVSFQHLYRRLIQAAGKEEGRTLRTVAWRSSVVNYIYRSTGDGISWIIYEIMKLKDRMKRQELQDITDRFIESQVLVPGKWRPIRQEEIAVRSLKPRFLRRIQQTLERHHEMI
jgi:hypothetical protein